MATTEAKIEIDRIEARTMQVPIVGTSPLLVHNFSQKAKQQMLDAQRGKKKVKEVRDPHAEYLGSLYRISNGDGDERYGFPVLAFKAATTSAARLYSSLTMTSVRQSIFMKGIITPADPQQLVEIHGEPQMREDTVRLGGPSRSADLRYRAEFPEWSATLEVTYIESIISQGSVLSLIDAGGLTVGVGEYRPERKGEYGTYKIDPDAAIEVIE